MPPSTKGQRRWGDRGGLERQGRGEGCAEVAQRTGTFRSDTARPSGAVPGTTRRKGETTVHDTGPTERSTSVLQTRVRTGHLCGMPLNPTPCGCIIAYLRRGCWRPRLEACESARAEQAVHCGHAIAPPRTWLWRRGGAASSYQCPASEWAHPGPATPRQRSSSTPKHVPWQTTSASYRRGLALDHWTRGDSARSGGGRINPRLQRPHGACRRRELINRSCHHLVDLRLQWHARRYSRPHACAAVDLPTAARACSPHAPSRARRRAAGQRSRQSYPSTRAQRPRAAPRRRTTELLSTCTLRPRAADRHHVGARAAAARPRQSAPPPRDESRARVRMPRAIDAHAAAPRRGRRQALRDERARAHAPRTVGA